VSYRPWTELLEPLLQCVSGSGRLALRPGHQPELCLIVPLMIAFSVRHLRRVACGRHARHPRTEKAVPWA